MKKVFTLSLLFLITVFIAHAQTKARAKIDSVKLKASTAEQSEKFKTNDTAYKKLIADKALDKFRNDSTDLKLTSCSFEKDANAMVLSDQALMVYSAQIVMERFKRIKIFNDNGKGEANIRIEYSNKFGEEKILAVVGETINYNNGKVEYTKLDSNLVYNVHTDKQKDAVVFTMPNVRAGSVIQYFYMWVRASYQNFPDWDFQCNLPTRYSEVNILLTPQLAFTQLTNTYQPFKKDTSSFNGYGHTWALENIPSVKSEPYMRAEVDGLQRVSIIIKGVKGYFGMAQTWADSWETIGKHICEDKDFSKEYDQHINDDDGLVKSAKSLKTDDEKIKFVFNQVKSQMGWNQVPDWRSKDGIKSAWKKRSGDWGEINMILCNLLKQTGIKAYPMLVSTRDNGLIYHDFPNSYQINKLVVYVPVDSTKYYVLDATDKYNLYNEIPYDLLNSNGLYLDKDKQTYALVAIKKEQPVRQVININAEIQPDGTMNGNAVVYDYSYNKSGNIELNKTLDEKKYEEYLTDNDNNLKITSLKLEDANVDSLPLKQNIEFKLDLSTNDEKYIYLNPNLFTSLRDNPFISEHRTTDIDFGYKNILSVIGSFKLPPGYMVDFLPKNLTIVNDDKTISFMRLLQENDGYITIHYIINYKKSTYSKDNYPALYLYFKKMYEMLNEQVVLKKS